MSSVDAVKPKRSHHKKKPAVAVTSTLVTKPSLGYPDPLAAAQEACRLAQEGSHKLSKAVDALRETLETIAIAEFDHTTRMPVSASDLRGLAVAGLDAYSALIGQNWRRHKLIGSRAGDRSLARLNEEGYSDAGG
jgi:hypothetical protein